MYRYFLDPSQRLEPRSEKRSCKRKTQAVRADIHCRAGNVYLFLCWEWSNDRYRFVERNVDVAGLVPVC
jgi:hypothetical protein